MCNRPFQGDKMHLVAISMLEFLMDLPKIFFGTGYTFVFLTVWLMVLFVFVGAVMVLFVFVGAVMVLFVFVGAVMVLFVFLGVFKALFVFVSVSMALFLFVMCRD